MKKKKKKSKQKHLSHGYVFALHRSIRQHRELTTRRQPPLELTCAYAACNMHERTTKTTTDRLRRSLSLIIARLRGKRQKKKKTVRKIYFISDQSPRGSRSRVWTCNERNSENNNNNNTTYYKTRTRVTRMWTHYVQAYVWFPLTIFLS